MKTAQQILEEAWALLQKPGVWIQGDFARTAEGHYIETLNDKAACFCSIGALCKVADAEPWTVLHSFSEEHAAKSAHKFLVQAAGGSSVACINDKAYALQDLAPMWEQAIKLAKEQS